MCACMYKRKFKVSFILLNYKLHVLSSVKQMYEKNYEMLHLICRFLSFCKKFSVSCFVKKSWY